MSSNTAGTKKPLTQKFINDKNYYDNNTVHYIYTITINLITIDNFRIIITCDKYFLLTNIENNLL